MAGLVDQGINSAEIDKALGEMFFGCNFPFIAVESPLFKNFVSKLNKNYKPPTAKTLSNKILNEAFNNYESSIKKVESKEATLQLDGWKNSASNKKYVVALLRINDGRHVFLDSWNFSEISETGLALTDVVNQCRVKARSRFNIIITAVVTDNASNMVLMGKTVDIWHSNCNSHSGNLLCKSLAEGPFADRVNSILKEFKSSELESKVVGLGGKRMILISKTRWCIHRDVYRRCFENLPYMRRVANDAANKVKVEIKNLLLDPAFEVELQDKILILDPICQLINTCQRKDCFVAEATELWLRLEIPAINAAYEQLLENRESKAINVYGLAANYLHPLYQGRRLVNNVDYMNQLEIFFVNNLSQEGLQELEHYKNRTGFFEDLFLQNHTSAITFWELASYVYPVLSRLAIRFNNIPASSAQLERLFSQWAHVHSFKRNRLREDRSAKLVSIYYKLRLEDPKVWKEILNNEPSDYDFGYLNDEDEEI